jgi:hypothetical protein
MKKIIKLSFILLIVTFIIGSTAYAALDCNVSIETQKTEFTEKEEFTVYVKISDIQSDYGVISFGGTLEYDKDSLTLVKMEAKNDWANPSYNESNGKFVMTRNSVTTSDETILEITFKVKEGSKQNLSITIKDMDVSDSKLPIKEISYVSKNITVKSSSSTDDNNTTNNTTNNTINNTIINNNSSNSINVSTNTSANTNKNTTNTNTNKNITNTNTNTNATDNTVSNKTMPNTGNGNGNSIIKILLFIMPIVAIYSYVRIENVDKKSNK